MSLYLDDRLAPDRPPPAPAEPVVTPAAGGHILGKRWRVPQENLFLRDRGHFSSAIGLGVDPAPYARAFDLLTR